MSEIEKALKMTETEQPWIAFLFSLIAGIFILLGGAFRLMLGSYVGYYAPPGMMGGYPGWSWGRTNAYPGYGYGIVGGVGFGFLGVLGLVFGAVVIVNAIMLNNKPEQRGTWGSLIVIFSLLSIFGSMMAGFGVGLILGLIGGILAITWKPTQAQSKT
jgi:hypothetical protein